MVVIEHEFLTPKEVAELLQISSKAVHRWFGHRPGVIDLGTHERMHRRRRRMIRIPRGAVLQFLAEKRAA